MRDVAESEIMLHVAPCSATFSPADGRLTCWFRSRLDVDRLRFPQPFLPIWRPPVSDAGKIGYLCSVKF